MHRILNNEKNKLVPFIIKLFVSFPESLNTFFKIQPDFFRYNALWIADAIDAVLQAAVETNTVLELNTRRMGSRIAIKELIPVYARYRELGGRQVTLGSDAHTADAVGNYFQEAREVADVLGLHIVTFVGRRMVKC